MSAVALAWLDRRGGPAQPRSAADVVKCLQALARVPFEVDQPTDLQDPSHALHNWIVLANGILDLDSQDELGTGGTSDSYLRETNR